MTSVELSSRLMPTVSETLAKEQRKGALEGLKNSVVHAYGLVAHGGNEDQAEMELGRHRRDQLTFERNTGAVNFSCIHSAQNLCFVQSTSQPTTCPKQPRTA